VEAEDAAEAAKEAAALEAAAEVGEVDPEMLAQYKERLDHLKPVIRNDGLIPK
jgi:hypothetical protein